MRPQEPVTRAFFATKSSLTQPKPSVGGTPAEVLVLIAALVLAAVVCLHNWWETLALVRDLHLTVPIWDYWRIPIHLQEIERFDLRFLWQQHNEHRIVFPELIFIADVLFFHALRILPTVVSCCCYAGSCLLLTMPVLRDHSLPGGVRGLIIITVGALAGWKPIALALTDPFLLTWTLTCFAALCALGALSSKRWLLALVITSGVVATYSSGTGMLIWPVLLAAAWLRKLHAGRMVALAISGGASIALYFVGYRFGHQSNPLELLRHPLYGGGFVAMYFGMPFGGMKSMHFGLYVGGFGLLAAFVLMWMLARRRGLASSTGITLCGWYLFSLLSALVIAAGRMNPADPTFTNAKATRYLVPVMLTWVALILLVLIKGVRDGSRVLRAAILSVVLLALLLIANRKLTWWFHLSAQPFVAGQITALSLENGLFEPELIRDIFPKEDLVAHHLPDLERMHLSIYYDAAAIGKPAPTATSGPSLESKVARLITLSSGVEVIGSTNEALLKRVFLTNTEGQLIGMGRHFPQDFPSELLAPGEAPRFAWIAFIPQRYAVGGFRVAVTASGSKQPEETKGEFALPAGKH